MRTVPTASTSLNRLCSGGLPFDPLANRVGDLLPTPVCLRLAVVPLAGVGVLIDIFVLELGERTNGSNN